MSNIFCYHSLVSNSPPTLGCKNSNSIVHVPFSTEGSKGGPVTCPVMICDGCLSHWLDSVGFGRSNRRRIYNLHCTIEKCQCQGEELQEYKPVEVSSMRKSKSHYAKWPKKTSCCGQAPGLGKWDCVRDGICVVRFIYVYLFHGIILVI